MDDLVLEKVVLRAEASIQGTLIVVFIVSTFIGGVVLCSIIKPIFIDTKSQ
jgi:hypothetical protein